MPSCVYLSKWQRKRRKIDPLPPTPSMQLDLEVQTISDMWWSCVHGCVAWPSPMTTAACLVVGWHLCFMVNGQKQILFGSCDEAYNGQVAQ